MNNELSRLRNEYGKYGLKEESMPDDPDLMVRKWLDDAIVAKIYDPNAMILSTSDEDHFPDSRVVLLKEILQDKYIFYTNKSSSKGKQIRNNNKAALLFFWPDLQRQIRIRGRIEELDDEYSDIYFRSRPRSSQLGAYISSQSEPVPDRDYLEQLYQQAEIRFRDLPVPRPENWGGYLVNPRIIEFWQGRAGRLHDRIVYEKEKKGWKLYRLAP